MAEGASRHFLAEHQRSGVGASEGDADRAARRLAELAWAGLRTVHRD
jgi:hypothetical protein